MRFYNNSGSTAGTITQSGTSSTSYNTSSDYKIKRKYYTYDWFNR